MGLGAMMAGVRPKASRTNDLRVTARRARYGVSSNILSRLRASLQQGQVEQPSRRKL